MNLKGSLDLLWGHLLSTSIFTIHSNTWLILRRAEQAIDAMANCPTGLWATIKLPKLRSSLFAWHVDLRRKLRIFLDLFLRVPEPFVDLIFFEVKRLRQVLDVIARWCLSPQLFIQLPKSVFLALRLSCSICFLILRGLFFRYHALLWFDCRLLTWDRLLLAADGLFLAHSRLSLGLLVTLPRHHGRFWRQCALSSDGARFNKRIIFASSTRWLFKWDIACAFRGAWRW